MFIATYSRQKNIVKRVKNFALPLARSSPVALWVALGRREHANGEVLTEGRGKFGLKEGRGTQIGTPPPNLGPYPHPNQECHQNI